MSEAAEQRVEELERELRGVQEMLYQVLNAVSEPVLVTKEILNEGITGDKMISIEEDVVLEGFVFSLVNPNEQ